MLIYGVNVPLPELFLIFILVFMIGLPLLIAFTIYKLVTYKIKEDYKKQLEKEIREKIMKESKK